MKVRRRVLVCINVDLQSVDLLNEGAAKEKNPLTVRLNPDVTARVQEELKVPRQVLKILDLLQRLFEPGLNHVVRVLTQSAAAPGQKR